MMKDKLERFVRDNRELFDTEELSDELWQKISTKLPVVEPKNLKTAAIVHPEEWALENESPRHTKTNPVAFGQSQNLYWKGFNWRIAASILLVVGLGSVYYANRQYQVVEQPEIALADLQVAKQLTTYSRLIEDKRIELQQITTSDPALYQNFAKELDQLEASYQNLRSDLPQNPNQEVVIKAMIENLQWQINLLNQQLDIIQRIKQSKNNHEKDKKTLV
jgi:hypothetical protein